MACISLIYNQFTVVGEGGNLA